MSILEAMAAGLPSIITTGCNFPEAGAAGAAKIVSLDANAIAAALGELASDPAACQAMGARARKLVLANYTWDQIATRFRSLVESFCPLSAPVP